VMAYARNTPADDSAPEMPAMRGPESRKPTSNLKPL